MLKPLTDVCLTKTSEMHYNIIGSSLMKNSEKEDGYMTKWHRHSVTLPDDLLQAIQNEGSRLNKKCSMSEIIRRLIRQGLSVSVEGASADRMVG